MLAKNILSKHKLANKLKQKKIININFAYSIFFSINSGKIKKELLLVTFSF